MAFAESLKENRRLTVLDLSYNQLGEIGGLYLGAGLVSPSLSTYSAYCAAKNLPAEFV